MKLEYRNEDQLFELIKKTIEPRLYKVSDLMSRHDCMLEGRDDVVVELKSRRTHYSTLLIEKVKYDYLVKFKYAFYVCYTPEGIYSFNIHTLNPVWETTLQPQTTQFYFTSKIEKQTYYIPIGLGKNILPSIMSKLDN